jgi:hypothetical protein
MICASEISYVLLKPGDYIAYAPARPLARLERHDGGQPASVGSMRPPARRSAKPA